MNLTSYISTSHELAKELLNRPDGFITITIGEREYMISKLKRKSTHANADDMSTYWTLCVDDECYGNIKRM